MRGPLNRGHLKILMTHLPPKGGSEKGDPEKQLLKVTVLLDPSRDSRSSQKSPSPKGGSGKSGHF